MRIGIVMNALESLVTYKDTTVAICLAAQKRGWSVAYIAHNALEIHSGKAFASAVSLKMFDRKEDFFSLGDFRTTHLASAYDIILMRQDPPVDQQYTYNLMVLQIAKTEGVVVANNPSELLQRNEKIGIAEFPALAPPTLVSASAHALATFAHKNGTIVTKPLDGMGGRGIFRTHAGDENFHSIIEMASNNGTRMVMAQKYIPEIVDGDKRIFIFDGVPWPYALARIPAKGELRANLAVGGRGETQELSPRDKEVATNIGRAFVGKGLYFVGIDVIGNFVTEINITSPTGAREMMRDTGIDPMETYLDVLASYV